MNTVTKFGGKTWSRWQLFTLLGGMCTLVVTGLMLSRDYAKEDLCSLAGGCTGLTIRLTIGVVLYSVGFFGAVVSDCLLLTRSVQGRRRRRRADAL